MMLLRAGVSARRIDDGFADLQIATTEQYALRCPASLADKLVPGMAELLRSLAALPEVTLSLVTGNLESVARLKLERAGIGEWFARGQGGFGSDSEDRTDLPPLARRRASGGRRLPTRVSAPWSSATLHATSPARGPTGCAAGRTPAPTRRPSSPRPTRWRGTPASCSA